MAAKSKHKYDVSEWLIDVINSCKTRDHWMTTKTLLELYEKKYPAKEEYDVMYNLHRGLHIKLSDKWDEINKLRT